MVEKKQTISASEDQDLHIAKHIETEQLPSMIQSLMALAQSDAERDMLLLSLITAAGSCMPNIYCRYGISGKKYYPNLQVFIVGSAASGKGIANLALEWVKPIHDATPLIIPGDSSYPGFYRQLARQNGRGYIHESEGSVITDVWRSSVANYNTALRKAAEHEPITRNRVKDNSSIPCPQLSVLLTGTYSQYRALVPSVENGYFSRLITFMVSDIQAFNSRYVQPGESSGAIISVAAQQLYRLYETLLFAHPREFQLTVDQQQRLGHHLENAYPTLIRMLGEDFHSVILRMAVHIERIAMILSVLRQNEESHQQSVISNQLVCTDTDYEIAEMIGNKLILHMAQAYQMIKGTEKVESPTIKPLDQKQILLSLLPEEFETKELIEEARAQGVAERTAARWNDKWIEEGYVVKIRQGHFRKNAISA